MLRSSHSLHRDVGYLFIDGAYLDEVMSDFGRKFWGVDSVPLDFSALVAGGAFRKCFYYNCPPPQQRDETDGDWERRARPYFDRMHAIGELPGFHIFEGTTKRHRKRGATQKEVDVQIAVDLLTNSFKGNMEFATLLAGDQDFRPVVEAATREGMYVTVWSERGSSSAALRAAADSRMYLEWHKLDTYVAKGFVRPYPLPTICAFGGVRLTDATATGTTAAGETFIMFDDSDICNVISTQRDENGLFYQYQHTDRQCMERALKQILDVDNWLPYHGHLPIAIGNI